MGSTARAAAMAGTGAVLLLQRGAALKEPVVLFYSGLPSADRALRLAALLAGAQAGKIIVLITPGATEDAKELEARAARVLAEEGAAAQYRALADHDAGDLCRAMRACGAGTVVLDCENPVLAPVLAKDAGVERLLDEVRCPVLLVR